MSSKSLFWWRLALCVVSVAFLLLYTSQYSSYREQYAKLMYKYSQSVVHSDGLAAQLRVMVERNQRIERLIEEMRTKQSLVMKENLEKCRVLESEKMTCLTNVKECEEESKALRLAVEASENKKKNELNMEQLKAQLESSQKKAIDLEKENNELIERLQRIEKDSKNVQIERDECLKKNENKTARLHKEGDAKAEVVAVPNARNYVENGKVRFDRVRPAGEVLAFERNPVAFVPPILLPNKILFEKLKKKNDRKEMSLADADDKENGAEVVELADAEERDYKEMH